ncbi:MAG: RHS repeat-associated core domain-containing protein [Prevotella sp.]|nr:RHS repeat-associated core domain-containing protein [Prevotella sp.]
MKRGIEKIRYFFLNLPSEISFTEKNAYIRNMYDANGNKFKMITYANIPLVIGRAAPAKASAVNKARAVGLIPDSLVYDTPFRNQFIPGLELIGVLGQTIYDYCGNIVYKNGVPTIYREDGFTTLARMRFPEFHYYIRDHQGNIRGVTDGRGNIEQQNDYYPFGGMMASSTGGAVQPYRYTGKELVRFQGLDWLDYGARWYDPATLRWNRVDPMAEKYTYVSPYSFCLNNPIRYVDLDGRAPGDKFKYPTLAALDFGMIYNKLSILENKEYASFIYKMLDKNGNVYYTYAGPARGRQNSVTQKGLDYSNINVEEVKGIVATIHTHADWSRISLDVDKDWNNTFSGDQGNPIKNRTWKGEKRANGKHKPDDISESNRTRTYSYLVTPNGTLKGYDPKSGKITVWSTSLPNSVSVKKTR